MKVFLEPTFSGDDPGDGGIRRVVEAQRKYFPKQGIEFVENIAEAELIHSHIAPEKGRTLPYLIQRPDIPFVLQNHGFYWMEYEWLPWAIHANADCMEGIRLADQVIAPSNWVAQSVRRNSLRPCTAIYHGVDIDEWPPLVKEGSILWNKTRVDPVCDPEPVGKLAEMLPDRKFVSTYGPKGLKNLHLTGTLPFDQAKGLVQRASLYLCTARETFGIGTLEAMASGAPVVGWAWGGQREIVHHKENGWLAPPGDYDALAEGVEYCFKHLKDMSMAAREHVVQHFQWSAVIPEYLKVYQQAISQKQSLGPKVSIVVTAHNLEQYLPEALDSVLQQSSKDWECIIVDDASPDACGAIADAYAARDERFHVLHNKTNLYLAGALNAGIAQARGKYILPLDADNILPPQTVEILSTALDHDRRLAIAYGNVEFLELDGRRWHSGWPPRFRTEWQIYHQEAQSRAPNLIPSGSMFRREVWELTGGYRRRWRTAEDADFWTRAASYGFRAGMVTEADVLVYRNRQDSMSRQENIIDWSAWYPWSRQEAAPPAAIDLQEQPGVPSYEPILISVIIPVGPGHEDLVIDAVDSVDAQTFRLWECIVVNDSGKELSNLPNWVHVLKTRKSHGVAKARNLGIQHAQGKLFVPLDADDTLEPHALAKMFQVWQEHKGYVYTDWFEKWDDGTMKVWELSFYRCEGCGQILFKGDRKEGSCPKCGSPKVSLETVGYSANMLIQKGCHHAVTALYPTDAWKRVKGFDESLPGWEDWDFQLKLANIGVCGTRIPEPLFTYRKSTGMRREENYAEFEKSKQGILSKWGEYFRGEKELMGCSKCPGGGGVQLHQLSSPAYSNGSPPPPNDLDQYAIIEYTGDRQGGINYRGLKTRQIYQFSALPTERMKYVRKEDLEYFLGMADFRLVERAAPVSA